MVHEKSSSRPKAAGDQAKGATTALVDSLKGFENAHRNYVREVHDAWEDAQQRYHHLCHQHNQILYDVAHEEPLRRYQAYQDRASQLSETYSPELTKKRFEEAYRNYLRALKDAWAEIDIDDIDLGHHG